MITYVTVDDVDTALGASWTDDSNKAKSVLMANAWMNGLSLKLPCDKNTHEIIIPDDVKLAGAYASQAAANNGLYQQQESSGVVSNSSVEAKGVKVAETYADISTNSSKLLSPDLQLAMALLRPFGAGSSQIKLVRG